MTPTDILAVRMLKKRTGVEILLEDCFGVLSVMNSIV
jgi:hypothetical protein